MGDGTDTVDYRIRPAKHSERNLLCDVIARLDRLEPITNFRYIGMGSIYFVDFIMIHRLFGISDMKSLEENNALFPRCQFNAPYDCIEVLNSSVASALPELFVADVPTIMWLDYDSKLSGSHLEEIRLAAASLTSPSLIVVSVNVHPDNNDERLVEFIKRFGERDGSRVTKPADLNRLRFPKLMWEYIDGAIRQGITSRSDHAFYEQILNIRYRDGAEMLTVGGLICDRTHDAKSCGFDSMHFTSSTHEAYDLKVPKLTYRERKALDALLPSDGADLGNAPPGLSEADIRGYAELYRHAPFYVDVEI